MPPSHSIHLFETRQPPFSAQWETQEKGRAEREGERRYGGNWLLYAFFTVGHEREKKRKEKRRTRKKWDGSSLSCFCFRSPGMGCCCWWKEWRRAQIARRKRNIGWRRRRRRRWTGLWEGEKERNKSGGKLYTSCYTCYTDILPFPSNLQLPFVGRVEGNGGRLRLHTYTLLLFHWKRKKGEASCNWSTSQVLSVSLTPGSYRSRSCRPIFYLVHKNSIGVVIKREESRHFFSQPCFSTPNWFFFRTQLRTSIDGPLFACLPTRKMLEGDIADHF